MEFGQLLHVVVGNIIRKTLDGLEDLILNPGHFLSINLLQLIKNPIKTSNFYFQKK